MPFPTFTMVDRQNQRYGAPVEYRPVIVPVGGIKHRLALHMNWMHGEWLVSDPVSGARVLCVQATHKGIPVSSRGIGPQRARAMAIAQVMLLAERVGAEKFNAKLAAATTN